MYGFIGYWNIEPENIDLETPLSYAGYGGSDDKRVIRRPGWGLGHHIHHGSSQSVSNESGTIFLVANNKIYNLEELKIKLERIGHKFRSYSGAEIMLHAYQEWEEDCFNKFTGMYAVAIVDIEKKICILARDHMGIKPLYFTRYKNGVVFSSNIKLILALPDFKRRLNRGAAHLFMNFRYLPDNQTLFENIYRIEPGCLYRVSDDNRISKKVFFSINKIKPAKFSDIHEAEEVLSKELIDAVKRHLVSDKEVGVYLSGGMDSSTLAYLASKEKKDLKTFCMNFGEPSDEAKDAEIIAGHVGSCHRNFFIGENPLIYLPEVIWHVEEPKVNSIQGYLLSKEASKYVKVVLSGSGGDELFAGYVNNDILYPATLLSKAVNFKTNSNLFSLGSVIQNKVNIMWLDHYFRIFDLSLSLFDPVRFYGILRNCFDHSKYLLNSIYSKPEHGWKDSSYSTLSSMFDYTNKDILPELLLLEMKTKLVNDFLLTEDKVAMAHGLEVRVPFLDKKLVELVLSIPFRWRYTPFNKKRILKNIVKNWLPAHTIKKRKWGFSFNPYFQFSRDLKKVALNVLTPENVNKIGLFSYDWIEKVVNSNPHPGMRWHYFNLWVMVGFTLWHEMFIKDFCKNPPGKLRI